MWYFSGSPKLARTTCFDREQVAFAAAGTEAAAAGATDGVVVVVVVVAVVVARAAVSAFRAVPAAVAPFTAVTAIASRSKNSSCKRRSCCPFFIFLHEQSRGGCIVFSTREETVILRGSS